MKLSELFPEMVKITIAGREHKLKFGTRATLQLETDYPDEKERAGLIVAEAVDGEGRPMMRIRSTNDLVNMLFAGLLHEKSFASKDELIDAIEPVDFGDYINAIFAALMMARATPEQLEKLQVMAESGSAKKKA